MTHSGGEPLAQADFVCSILQACRCEGIHTAIDTSGLIPIESCKHAVDATDLMIIDIKHMDNDKCKQLTGISNYNTFKLLEYCEQTHKPVWLRHVVVPSITEENDIEQLSAIYNKYNCIERVQLLPFHKLGAFKWEQLHQPFVLADTPIADKQYMARLERILDKCHVLYK